MEELAEVTPARGLFGVQFLHALPGEQIQDAELSVTQPLIDERLGCRGHVVQRDRECLPYAPIGRHPVLVDVIRDGAEPDAEGFGLLAAGRGQLHVGIARVEAMTGEPVRSAPTPPRCLRFRRVG